MMVRKIPAKMVRLMKSNFRIRYAVIFMNVEKRETWGGAALMVVGERSEFLLAGAGSFSLDITYRMNKVV